MRFTKAILNKKIITINLLILLTFSTLANKSNAQVAGYGAIPSVDEVSEGGGFAGGDQNTSNKNSSKTTQKKAVVKKSRKGTKRTIIANKSTTKSKPRSTKPYDGFIIGDKYTFLNNEVESGPNPIYTIAAKKAGAKGLVQVEVLIDTDGTVLTAKARTGNKLLHPEAEKAALETVFNQPSIYGKPARAIGFLVYRFGKAED